MKVWRRVPRSKGKNRKKQFKWVRVEKENARNWRISGWIYR